MRWPGGCFADDYHWEDGVGPREERPRRVNLWWGNEESNQFGTHEFVDFCRRVGAEPYVCVNVGSGSPLEAKSWMEYCNYDGDTHYARLRAANGAPEPFDVRWWAVGNENWGCGGRFQPEEYAAEYRRFACYLRVLGKRCQLVACGHTTPDWNRRFLVAVGQWDLMDHLSIHRYYHRGHQTDFSEEDYYGLFAETTHVHDDIRHAAHILDDVIRGHRFVGIVVDEWGVWHREAKDGLGQINTQRDAVAAAGVLDTFNRWCTRVTMGNLAQTINVLQCLIHTDGPRFWLTPTYHVFDLYKGHMGNEAVRVLVDCESTTVERSDGPKVEVRLVSCSASVSRDRKSAFVTLTNRSLDRSAECTFDLVGGPMATGVEARVLAAEPAAHNTAEEPERVKAREADLGGEGAGFTWQIPPCSVVGGRIALA